MSVGSRKLGIEADRKWYRKIVSFGFQTLVKLLFGFIIKDTQNGFKLMKR